MPTLDYADSSLFCTDILSCDSISSTCYGESLIQSTLFRFYSVRIFLHRPIAMHCCKRWFCFWEKYFSIPTKIPIGKNCHCQKVLWHFSYMAISVGVLHVFAPSKTFAVQLWKSESMPWKTKHCHYWRPKVNDKFDSVWSNHLAKTQHTLAMEQNLENYDFGLKDANNWQCH